MFEKFQPLPLVAQGWEKRRPTHIVLWEKILGYILKRLKLPIVPIVLGMVLGNIMEQKFRASLARVETPLDFIDRPVSATIFVFIVLALIGQGVSIVRARKTKALSQ